MKDLDLDTLIQAGQKIFVRNTSRPMGHIVLTFTLFNGKTISRPIPRTWIPICLSDTLSPDIILQSHDLRSFLTKRILLLVDPEQALKDLSTPEAQEELSRLNVSDFSAKGAATARVDKLAQQQNLSVNLNNPMQLSEDFTVDPVTNRVKSVILQVEAKDMTEREAVADLRVMQSELSQHDLTYIVSQSKQDGPLRRFAQQTLSALAAEIDSDVISQDEADVPEDPAAVARARANQAIEK